jgi:hypothetical protein
MIRQVVTAGLVASLAAPMLATTPASAAELFHCSNVYGRLWMVPGLSHTQTAQHDAYGSNANIAGCSNGNAASLYFGAGNNLDAVTSYPPRPLGCPTVMGGAGPDYADKTPVLIGGPNSLVLDWSTGANSAGIFKMWSSDGLHYPELWRFRFSIRSGQYAPPPGKKTLVNGNVMMSADDTFSCADDSDPITTFRLRLAGTGTNQITIAQQ